MTGTTESTRITTLDSFIDKVSVRVKANFSGHPTGGKKFAPGAGL